MSRLTTHIHTAQSSVRHRRALAERSYERAVAVRENFIVQLVTFFFVGGMLGCMINLIFGV